jgi:hypothetical protein
MSPFLVFSSGYNFTERHVFDRICLSVFLP